MNSTDPSHRFGGTARVFEWLLSFLLLAAALSTIAIFLVVARLSFADTVPDYLIKEVEVEIGKKSLPELTQLPTSEIDHVSAKLTLPTDHVNIYLTYHVVALIGVIIAAVTTFHLRQFVQSLRRTHPFLNENAKRLRTVAWLVLFGGIWQLAGRFIQTSELSRVFPELDLELTVAAQPMPLVLILTLFVVAEVFALGVKMKAEADLTV